MKKNATLYLIMISFMISGCNEKVSPNLQSSSATSGSSSSSSSSSSTTVIPPTTYYFGITNKSDTLLGYKLHKTGDGNYSTDCKISSTTAFSNAIFTNPATQADNDISCYYEAEELSLFFNGFDISYDASQNTCEYVGYSPYSYFDAPPGSSTATYAKITCADAPNTPSQANIDTFLTSSLGLSLGAAAADHLDTLQVNCGDYVDVSTGMKAEAASVGGTNIAPRSGITTDTDLCNFNYTTSSGGALNCDTGVLTISEYTLDSSIAAPFISGTPTTTTVKCGGKIANCAQGAIRQDTSLNNFTRGTIITKPSTNTVVSIDKTFSSPFSLNRGNYYYANFRRDLASSTGDFQASWSSDYTNSAYTDLFAITNVGNESFTPLILDRYTNNKREDGTTANISAAANSTKKYSNGHSAEYYAAETFVGMGGASISPAYTFYCFDNAFDIKARIRMYVRDWDRSLPGTSTINTVEMISDIGTWVDANTDTNAHMDIPGVYEIQNDNDGFLIFNDRSDWDDLIPMARTEVGAADFYVPVAGWWANGNFPWDIVRND